MHVVLLWWLVVFFFEKSAAAAARSRMLCATGWRRARAYGLLTAGVRRLQPRTDRAMHCGNRSIN
jgi:hypothetical protein